MAKRRQSTIRRAVRAKRPAAEPPAVPEAHPAASPSGSDAELAFGALSLHQLFEQQTREMLDRTDLDEEQKQHILVAMNCPCCGAGGMSYTAKLKR